MAQYQHLPVYKAVYDLNLYFYKLSRGFPKDFKYGLGQEVRSKLSELLDQIVIINNLADKQKAISDTEVLVERIKFQNRLLKDLEVSNLRSFKHFSKQLVDVSKQLSAWKKWDSSKKGRS